MKKNLFAAEPRTEQAEAREVREPQARRLSAPDYTASPCGLPDHIVAFILGFVAGFAVLYIFYKLSPRRCWAAPSPAPCMCSWRSRRPWTSGSGVCGCSFSTCWKP